MDNSFIEAFERYSELLNERSNQIEQALSYLRSANSTGKPVTPAAAAAASTGFQTITSANSLASKRIDYGPIQNLVDDDNVNDILINGYKQIYIERAGKLEITDLKFASENEVLKLAVEIAESCGRKLNPGRPLVDARLPDGSRVNIIAMPLTVDGTVLSIRKFAKRPYTLDSIVGGGGLSQSMADFLKVCAKSRLNMIISGGTGAGKTTLLNAISESIEHSERIVTIEDAAELRLQQPHVVRMETKPFDMQMAREDEVTIRDLVKNSLRMRPDRIIVGEVRGPEAFDMMQAMNTGHEGSMCTVHANHPRDAMSRLENMITMANLQIPLKSIRYQLASAVNLFIQISRMRDGKRRISEISEVTGMEGDVVVMQDIFLFKPEKEEANGNVVGSFRWTGIMPRFVRRAAYYKQLGTLEKALGVKIPINTPGSAL